MNTTKYFANCTRNPQKIEGFTLATAVSKTFGDSTPNKHLAPLDSAIPGDLIAMVAGFTAEFETRDGLIKELEGFYVQGADRLEIALYSKVPARQAAHAAHLVAEDLFLSGHPHNFIHNFNMVDCTDGYQIQSIHFADAVLYISTAWLLGWLDCEEINEKLCPVVFEMPAVFDLQQAEANAEKARKYLEIVEKTLPAHLQGLASCDLILPKPEDFMSKKPQRMATLAD